MRTCRASVRRRQHAAQPPTSRGTLALSTPQSTSTTSSPDMALLPLLSPAAGVGVRWNVAAAGVTPAIQWCDARRRHAPGSEGAHRGDASPPPPPCTVTTRAHAAPRRCATVCGRQQTPAAGRAQAARRSAWTCSATVHTYAATRNRGRLRQRAGSKRVNTAPDARDRTQCAYARTTRRQRKCATGQQSGGSRFRRFLRHGCGCAFVGRASSCACCWGCAPCAGDGCDWLHRRARGPTGAGGRVSCSRERANARR
jgi:hypothetical protein